MNKIYFLKKILPGFLPLLVFIVVDSFLGTKAGIVFAICFGWIELLVIYLKERRIDKFVIGDTILLVALGTVSILLENEIFFMLKPALIELIFCALIGISVFSKENLILKISQRYMKGVQMTTEVEHNFRRSLKIMFYLFSIHVLLIIYSAYFMSKEAWGFISGGLFYILFGIYAVYEFIRNKLNIGKIKNEEWFPLVDEEGRVTGKASRSVCHSGSKLLHPVIHVHVFNSKGQIFLQKRARTKKIQAGKWDTAVGGHISLGESLEEGLAREVEEEIGLKDLDYEFVTKYIWESEIEKELTYVFFAKQNGEIKIQPEEIDDGKFWSWKDINKTIGNGVFTPNLEHEFEKFKHVFLSKIS